MFSHFDKKSVHVASWFGVQVDLRLAGFDLFCQIRVHFLVRSNKDTISIARVWKDMSQPRHRIRSHYTEHSLFGILRSNIHRMEVHFEGFFNLVLEPKKLWVVMLVNFAKYKLSDDVHDTGLNAALH